MDRIFDIDFKKMVVQLLPSFLRREKLIALLWSLTVGVRTLHFNFLSLQFETAKELKITPQVFSIRKLLNDYFDSVNRTIRIEDANLNNRTYIFTEGEKQPLFLGGKPIYTADELRLGIGFIVIVPESLNNSAESSQLRAMINKYKLAGTKYTIRYE